MAHLIVPDDGALISEMVSAFDRLALDRYVAPESVSRFGEAIVAATEFLARSLGVAAVQCDDGSTKVDCEFILRPSGDAYYRCVGHSPPHCYGTDYQTRACP